MHKHREISQLCSAQEDYLIIDEMCPIVPKTGKINRPDEVSLNTLQYNDHTMFSLRRRFHHKQIDIRTIQNPLRNDAIASAATKMGMIAATKIDWASAV
jgi:hypothetical protein